MRRKPEGEGRGYGKDIRLTMTSDYQSAVEPLKIMENKKDDYLQLRNLFVNFAYGFRIRCYVETRG